MDTLGHADRSMDKELSTLQAHLQKMGQWVLSALQLVQHAARTPADPLWAEAKKLDKQINQLEQTIEEAVMGIFSRHQPLMEELRLVTFSMKLAVLLERLGDLAKNSVRRLCKLRGLPKAQADALEAMARQAQTMVQTCMALLAKFDAEQVQAVLHLDDAVDAAYKSLKKELRSDLHTSAEASATAQRTLQVARDLERAADFAVDIACIIHFIATGKRLHKKDIA